MTRRAIALQVPADSLPEYERRHRNMGPEMRAAILASGARSFSLFAAPDLNSVFMYVEIDDIERWEAGATSRQTAEWWSYMADVMPTNADNSPISTELPEVFHLGTE